MGEALPRHLVIDPRHRELLVAVLIVAVHDKGKVLRAQHILEAGHLFFRPPVIGEADDFRRAGEDGGGPRGLRGAVRIEVASEGRPSWPDRGPSTKASEASATQSNRIEGLRSGTLRFISTR